MNDKGTFFIMCSYRSNFHAKGDMRGKRTWIQIRGGIEYNRLARTCAAFTDVARFWAFTDQPVNFYQPIGKVVSIAAKKHQTYQRLIF